jgi:putative transposase
VTGLIMEYRDLDKLFISIDGKYQYLWCAVDKDGDTIVMAQSRRDKRSGLRFFRKLFRGQESAHWKMITYKLKGFSSALREMAPSSVHITDQAQCFLSLHELVNNLLR